MTIPNATTKLTTNRPPIAPEIALPLISHRVEMLGEELSYRESDVPTTEHVAALHGIVQDLADVVEQLAAGAVTA